MAGAPETPDRPGAATWVPTGADVDALRAAAPDCRGCELWEPATQVVFSAGSSTARLALVGEQPGDQEDQRGIPFVGPAGQLLARAVDAAEIARGDVYVTNAVKHFRFDQRGRRRIHAKPGVAHVEACHPWLEAELTVVAPRVVVCLGATAARSVLGRAVTISKVRGSLLDEAAGPVLVTTHPSALLRMQNDTERAAAFEALVADLVTAAAAAA